MTRLPIARSLPLALLGLTLALGLVAALSVASLYGSRQDYEDELARAYEVETATAVLVSAGVVREAVERSVRPTQARRDAAQGGYDDAAERLRTLARGDAASERLAADLAGLPAKLDHVDALAAEGVLGGAEPTAADLQIAATLRVLLTVGDLHQLLADRPAGELARRWFPDYAGHVPAGAYPAGWVPTRG